MLETVDPQWAGEQCIIAATGPSLTKEVADICRRVHEQGAHRIVAVNDAYRLLPFADVLYACDTAWWELHRGCPNFTGEKWSCHNANPSEKGQPQNNKIPIAKKYGLRLVAGRSSPGFSYDPKIIHYGCLSGYQAINWTILRGALKILLVGFDMHSKAGRHFFGNHPRPLRNSLEFETKVSLFAEAKKSLPHGIEIVNCTPGSELKCFRVGDLKNEILGNC